MAERTWAGLMPAACRFQAKSECLLAASVFEPWKEGTIMTCNTTPQIEKKALRGLLACTLALCLCATPAALVGCSSGDQGSSSASSQSANDISSIGISVTLTASNGDELLLEETIEGLADGATVLDVLETAPADVVVEDSSYGPYITSIDGLAADATHGWTYTVNGEQPVESAGSTVVADGDSIAWTYIEFTPESA